MWFSPAICRQLWIIFLININVHNFVIAARYPADVYKYCSEFYTLMLRYKKLTTIKSEGRSSSMSSRMPTRLSSVLSEISPYHLLFSGSEPSYANMSGQGDGGWTANDKPAKSTKDQTNHLQICDDRCCCGRQKNTFIRPVSVRIFHNQKSFIFLDFCWVFFLIVQVRTQFTHSCLFCILFPQPFEMIFQNKKKLFSKSLQYNRNTLPFW